MNSLARAICTASAAYILAMSGASADTPRDYAVPVKLSIDSSAVPGFLLSWPADTSSLEWHVFRKGAGKLKFGSPLVKLDSAVTSFFDSNIKKGVEYEYCVQNFGKKADAWSYVSAGRELPAVENRGRVLVLVDSTMAAPLGAEISRLESDLTAEGWLAKVIPVPRAESFSAEKVAFVKNIILKEFADKDSVRAILLLGRVPVPYSGNNAIDGHDPDHMGAWPADVFYADVHGKWTDVMDYPKVASESRQYNSAGDGKFDKSYLDTDPSICLGRVDFYNMPWFSLPETELLRRYLGKDHDFRTGKINYPRRGIISDNFGMYTKEAFAACGWMNFNALCGIDSTTAGDMQNLLPGQEFMWAYGCGPGDHYSAAHAAYASEYAEKPQHALFLMIFGSYLGDWDYQNDMLRAAIASEPSALICAWAGRPFWHFHRLNADATFGDCTLLTQINQYEYPSTGIYGNREVHIALMGDPTLTQYALKPAPVPILKAVGKGPLQGVEVSWPDDGRSYHVFRADKPGEFFRRVSDAPAAGGSYFDKDARLGMNYYMIRPLKLIETPTSTFYKLGPGAVDSVFYPVLDEEAELSARIAPNPVQSSARVIVHSRSAAFLKIEMFNSRGSLLLKREEWIESGYTITELQAGGLPSGDYFIRLRTPESETTEVMSVVR